MPERFSVENAGVVLAELRAALAADQDVRIDLSRVAMIDTAALQLLVAVRREQHSRGRGCELDGVPEPVLECARLLGVERLLGLTQVCP